jgi:hypothetical protein
MLSTFVPARQQAHDLIDRLTPAQVSAFIALFETAARGDALLVHAPFCDELPIDSGEAGAFRVKSVRATVARTTAA